MADAARSLCDVDGARSPVKFVAAIAVARGARYVVLGLLAIRYGDLALELIRTRGRDVALLLAGLIVIAAVGWWWLRRPRA